MVHWIQRGIRHRVNMCAFSTCLVTTIANWIGRVLLRTSLGAILAALRMHTYMNFFSNVWLTVIDTERYPLMRNLISFHKLIPYCFIKGFIGTTDIRQNAIGPVLLFGINKNLYKTTRFFTERCNKRSWHLIKFNCTLFIIRYVYVLKKGFLLVYRLLRDIRHSKT